MTDAQTKPTVNPIDVAMWPEYRCHKVVRALKVADLAVVHGDGSVEFRIADGGFTTIMVNKDVVSRYMPVPGDYLVVYDNGYMSASPQKPFEEGYSRL